MVQTIVFDMGGTLMEYVGMPLNWSDFYLNGFEHINETFKLELSESELKKSAEIMEAFNPRFSRREYELAPEFIFSSAISGWRKKPNIGSVAETFFSGLKLDANIYDYSIDLLSKCKKAGFKTACLTDLPNGMPDSLFKPAVVALLPYMDLYVSSQVCGVRKPNKGGLCYIADKLEILISEILFVGDEEKDLLTARNAGCSFAYIDDFRTNSSIFEGDFNLLR